MNKVGFIILVFVTIVILVKANKARQLRQSYYILPHTTQNYDIPDDLYDAANPATAVGNAFTDEQKRRLAKKSNLHKDRLVQSYIKRFKQTALQEAKLYSIPASIKLAQGIIESNAGQSKLAVKENNHFGIKCMKRIKCKCATYADDSPTDQFRVFTDAWSSYREHSKLLTKDRYKHLLKLDPHDYKGWAYGLQKAGYATNPNYAKLLITIIEKYQLHKIH